MRSPRWAGGGVPLAAAGLERLRNFAASWAVSAEVFVRISEGVGSAGGLRARALAPSAAVSVIVRERLGLWAFLPRVDMVRGAR